ncbi:craniofacial development protein 2-like [Montipora foliosa]|uniref:craniofacial development protein 2-like n=1 Tax=Montipora foliosa TaxID=591990 RepID=UPI0035F1DDAC
MKKTAFCSIAHVCKNRERVSNSKKYVNTQVKLNICCWDVRTLLDNISSKRAERRTALVTKELQRLNIDVAALSETRLSDEDQLVGTSTGYTFVWVGKPKGEQHGGDVGFAILTDLVDQLECPYSMTNRIMKVCIPLSCGRYLSILSVYVPTLQVTEDTLPSFYSALRIAVTVIPKEEKLILLGDFNARVGLRLLELCSDCDLVISNTFFWQKGKHKVTL